MSGQQSQEHELLARLGLSDGASEAEVESAHADVVTFLQGAPAELRAWARAQVAAADEAYALLSDPDAVDAPAPPAPEPRKAPAKAAATQSKRRVTRTIAPEPPPAQRLRVGPLARILIGAVAVVGVLAAGYWIYTSDLPQVPGLTGTPVPESSQAAIDTARVAQLMQAIQANPNDIDSLQELANIYFGVGDYGVAADWENRIIAVDPNNVLAHLALGAAQYNLGNSADAEANWRRVIELNPTDVNLLAEAHYDLGFMYFSASPPDTARTIAEWQAVIDIAPDSTIAQTVMAHMPQLQSPGPSASAGASVSPGPSASPAPSATPVVTAQPSATASQ